MTADLDHLTVRPDWMTAAACRGRSDVDFFPGRGEPGDEARAICATCQVRDDCLDYALSLPGNADGVWAGTSKRERVTLRRRQRAA